MGRAIKWVSGHVVSSIGSCAGSVGASINVGGKRGFGRMSAVCGIVLLAAGLSGCGNYGALYLPSEQDPNRTGAQRLTVNGRPANDASASAATRSAGGAGDANMGGILGD